MNSFEEYMREAATEEKIRKFIIITRLLYSVCVTVTALASYNVAWTTWAF